MATIDTRRILISWRPEAIEGGPTVLTTREWVSVLEKKLRKEGHDRAKRRIEVVYLGKAGDSKAEDRDVGSYTDFVAVVSDDYCVTCDEEERQQIGTELLAAAKLVRDTTSSLSTRQHAPLVRSDTLNLWTTPISKGHFRQAQVGGTEPWSLDRWHHLKPEPTAFTRAKTDNTFDSEIAEHAVDPIIEHIGCGENCNRWLRNGEAPNDSGSKPSLLKRVFGLFGR